jgi:hypothetical protein
MTACIEHHLRERVEVIAHPLKFVVIDFDFGVEQVPTLSQREPPYWLRRERRASHSLSTRLMSSVSGMLRLTAATRRRR